jgi:hypothetical protein
VTDRRVHPFELRVPDTTLDDLRRRLAATRLPDALVGTGWDDGTDVNYLRSLVAYWRHEFVTTSSFGARPDENRTGETRLWRLRYQDPHRSRQGRHPEAAGQWPRRRPR